MADSQSSQMATALLTEHLQYTPLSLIDDIINSVNNFIYQGIASLETGLQSMPPAKLGFRPTATAVSTATPATDAHADAGDQEFPDATAEIEEGLHQLETLLNSTVDKNFDKFEIYVLRNILSVPADLVPWVRLSHYENVTYPPPEHAPTVESVQLLRRKLTASRTVSHALQREQQRNEAILRQLRAIVDDGPQLRSASSHPDPSAPDTSAGPDASNASNAPRASSLAFLTHDPAALALHGSTQPDQQALTTHVHFTLSQLPALRSLLADLRPRLAALKETGAGAHVTTAKDERREERREYIEQRIQSHLGDDGPGHDERAMLTAGKRVDRAEVEALERVTYIFDPD